MATTTSALVPATWRTTISIFVDAMDTVTATFKASKDLAVGNGGATVGATVEMEPKLPVG